MDRYDEFVADSGFFTGVSETEAETIAAILRKHLAKPVIAPMPVDGHEFGRWLDAYPARKDDLVDLHGDDEAHQNAVSLLLGMAHSRVGDIFLDIQTVWSGASRVKPEFLYQALREKDLLVERVVACDLSSRVEALFGADIDYADPGIVQVCSSNGDVYADRTGKVVSISPDWRNADVGVAIPLKFDFPEYEEYWNEALPASFDILDLGFASSDGECVRPAMDWREDVRRNMEAEKLGM